MRDVPQALRKTHRSATRKTRAPSTCAKCDCEPGQLTTTGWNPAASKPRTQITSGQGELAFLGDALEGFARALDPVLTIVPFGRQLTDHLVGAGGGRTRHIACSEIDSRPNRELVLQRPLHTQDFPAFSLSVPEALAG